MSLEAATDEQRDGVLLHLRDLVGRGAIDLERFELLASVVLGARSLADLADVMAKLPLAVPMTPASRRFSEPLELRALTGSLKMTGRWQVGRVTEVHVATGRIVVDLTDAELDDREIDMSVRVATGSAKVIIPFTLDVQLARVAGSVKNNLGPNLAPSGAPLLRLDLGTATGSISLLRPKVPTPRWWQRRRNR